MVYGGAVASGAFAGPGRHALRLRRSRAASRRTSRIAIAGHDRLPDRRDRGLGDRRLPRPSVARAPRPLAAPERREARPRGALVRPLGGVGRLPRPADAGRCARSSPIPAGVFRAPIPPLYVWLTLLGSAIWCFAFAGDRLGAGASWETFHHAFRYVDYVVVALPWSACGAACAGLGRTLRRRVAGQARRQPFEPRK